MSVKKQLIFNILWNLFHTAWQLTILVLATIKWSWAGFGISFVGLFLFNLIESLVFHIIAKIRGAKADRAYNNAFK